MNTEDKDKLRKVSFQEFADKWLDSLSTEYDAIGNLWIDLFRDEIREYLNNIRNKIDTLITLIKATGTEEAYDAFVAEFAGHEDEHLPAYEALLPIIRALGGRDEDTALTIISIFKYARARRLGGAERDNITAD